MKHNALALALLTAATTLPATSHAADDFCSRLFIYAVNQFCQLLPNGQSLCQPVGLAGPSPSCESPGASAMVQVPLGPPVIQMPQFPSYTAGQNSFAPPAFAANPFGNNPFVPNPYAPAAAYFPSNMLPARSYLTPMPTPALPKSLAPAADIVSAQKAAESLTKRVPEQTAKQEAAAPVTETATVASSEIVRPPVAPPVTEPAKPDAAPVASAATAAAPNPIQATPSTPVAAAAVVPSAVVSSVVSAPASQALPVAATTTAVTPATESTVLTPASPVAAAIAMPAPATLPVAAAITEVAPVKLVSAEPATTAAIAVPETIASQATETSLPEKTTPTIGDALAHFEFDSAELTAAGRSMLDDWIKQASGKTPIVVTGHTDRLGPEPYNEKLSLLRAEAVKKYLAEKGKTAKRIVILGKGEKAPVVDCAGDATPETKSCLAPNRRAEITLKPVVKRAKVSSKPGKTQSTR